MIFKDIQGEGGDLHWEVAGIPLHALCLVSIQSVGIRAVCIRYACVCTWTENWDKLCTYEGLAAKRMF